MPAVFYSLDELLKTDVEAVVLATPIPDHANHVVAALGAGKHVLSEVTCATTMEDCLRIANAVKTAKGKYMMEENYCYYRPLTIVQNMIKAGLLGDIYYGESDYLMDFQLRPGFPDKLAAVETRGLFRASGASVYHAHSGSALFHDGLRHQDGHLYVGRAQHRRSSPPTTPAC